jgi:hypothetical protein
MNDLGVTLGRTEEKEKCVHIYMHIYAIDLYIRNAKYKSDNIVIVKFRF